MPRGLHLLWWTVALVLGLLLGLILEAELVLDFILWIFRTHGVTVQPDTFATIGISPTKVDNTDLSISLIGRQACFEAGDHIDSHLNMNQVLQDLL